ncbi:NADH-quinone oxidoreductase subunit A [bacterium]|nr:NADH-quinone oxidoreductase subunit A [bacterium]
MNNLFILIIFALLSLFFAIASVILGFVCQYKDETKEKSSTYECGVQLFSDARKQYNLRFFNYALFFLMFDVELIFLYPFAMNFSQLKLYAIFECVLFLLLILFTVFYAVKQNILRWK